MDWKTVALSALAAGVVSIAVVLATWSGGETTVVVQAQPTPSVCEMARETYYREAVGNPISEGRFDAYQGAMDNACANE